MEKRTLDASTRVKSRIKAIVLPKMFVFIGTKSPYYTATNQTAINSSTTNIESTKQVYKVKD